jgi:DNA mismatch repair protein MutS2
MNWEIAEYKSDEQIEEDNNLVELTDDAVEMDCSVFEANTLETLEWGKITKFFASLCRTEWARHCARRLSFFATRIEAEREFLQVEQAHRLLIEQGETLPVVGIPDLRPSFTRLDKGAALDASALLGIADMLECVAQLRNFLKQFSERLPAIWEKGELLKPLGHLRQQIVETIDRNGKLRDSASWELGSLREEARRCHDRIRRKMREYLSPPMNRYLTDTYYTLRQDRYVLPVKASDRGRIAGIVYGSSGSGATVYVEPQPLVEQNNALRLAEDDVIQEETRILQKLSQKICSELNSLRTNLELIKDFDLLQARVRLAEVLDASIPKLLPADQSAKIDLKHARHPLLLLKGVDVVANDIALGPQTRSLIISGPNTGGKTVAIKTIGVCALMARAGLPIPAEAGSCMPFFDAIYTDIGDQQSIERDLSTFSAQIIQLREILIKLQSNALVLIDEIVVGTDPQQGAALATALLEQFASSQAFVAITTHYEQLKALAYQDDRFINASVGFDLQRLSPTYRLYIGTPGSSSAIDIAKRLGLSEDLCLRAEQMLSPSDNRFDRIISQMEQQYEELYEERQRATRARSQLEKTQLEQQRKNEQIDQFQHRLRSGEEQNWRKQFREARDLLREAVHTLQQTGGRDWRQVHDAQRKLQAAEEQARQARQESQIPHPQPAPSAQQLYLGQKVYILSLNTHAEIIELPDANAQVLLQIGALRTRTPIADIRPISNRDAQSKPRANTTPPSISSTQIHTPTPISPHQPEAKADFSVIPGKHNKCDLRGQQVEQALDTVAAFLDQSMQNEIHAVLLIHGHGTGILREAVRQYCKTSPYIRQFRPGDATEGGNGVTAVLLH